jgi:transcription elongation GreA/GreB family factor
MSVAFVREESAEAAQEITLPERPISTHPNLVTRSGLKALERAAAESAEALKAAQAIEDAEERRRALELAARDARYFSERLASTVLRPEPTSKDAVAFGHRVTILRDGERRQTFRIVGEDEADPARGSISHVSPLARAMFGKRVGDVVAAGAGEAEIIRIR